MRIGLVCPYDWEVPGGVREHISGLAEALIELGHYVSVITPADDDAVLLLNVGARGPAVESRERVTQGLAPVAPIGGEQNVDVLEFHRRVHRDSPRSLGRKA